MHCRMLNMTDVEGKDDEEELMNDECWTVDGARWMMNDVVLVILVLVVVIIVVVIVVAAAAVALVAAVVVVMVVQDVHKS